MGRCTFLYDIPMSLDEIGNDIKSWINGEHRPKLDEWFSEYGLDFV